DALHHPFGAPGTSGRLKMLSRKVGRGIVGRGRTVSATSDYAIDPLFSVFAFERLAWVQQAVARGGLHALAVSSPAAVASLREHGLEAIYQPIARWEAMGAPLGQTRDLDALFLGASGDERGQRLHALASALDRRGVHLTIVDRASYGRDRTAL